MLRKVLSIIGCSFTALVALAFSFIEIRSIVAGDFTLMNNQISSLVGYLFRALYFLFLLALCITLIISKVKNNVFEVATFGAAAGLFIGAIVSFAFYHMIVSIAVILVALIPLIITILDVFIYRRKIK